MAQVLKVGSVDLSSYVRVAHEDGLDPANPSYSEPQFTGSPAFSEGQSFVGDAVSNRLMSFPLLLKAKTTDALYALVREINGELVKGESVEYRSGGATQSTFFDLERGRLEPQFEFWIDQASRVRAMLHLWVRPYGHTGTYRTVMASVAATGPQQFSVATGILGDHPADMQLRVDATPTYLEDSSAVHTVAYGITPQASYVGIWKAASVVPVAAGTVVGASGAVASQYLGLLASPNAGQQAVAKLPLSGVPLSAYAGRQRLLMIARSRIAYASGGHPALTIADSMGGVSVGHTLASVPLATQNADWKAAGWKILDFGEWQVPKAPSGFGNFETELDIEWWTGASVTASVIASPALQINALVMVPLDTAPGIQQGTGWQLGGGQGHLMLRNRALVHNYNASTFWRDESSTLRGAWPVLPPTGSPTASGALQMVFLAGNPNFFLGNKPVGVTVAARENFQFLR